MSHADERRQPLLEHDPPGTAASSSAGGTARAVPASLQEVIDGSGFGAFQWKICVLVGALVYMPAGWIMLPVFANPQLAQQDPEVFTETRWVHVTDERAGCSPSCDQRVTLFSMLQLPNKCFRWMLYSLALLGSAFFAGWAVGAPLCSSAADKVGRKMLSLSVLPVAVLVGILPILPETGTRFGYYFDCELA